MRASVARAIEVLSGPALDAPPRDPLSASTWRVRAALGTRADPAPILEQWRETHLGSPVGDTRYRWPANYERTALPPYADRPAEWVPWREADRKLGLEPRAFASRLIEPIVLLECGEFLAELADGGHPPAADFLREAEPVMRRDFANYIRSLYPWTDTFALWSLARHPRMLRRLHPFALAVATCYATMAAEHGHVIGLRYPFHEKPLSSATAQLASALLTLGQELGLASRLVEWLKTRSQGGVWSDGDGPADLLSTFVVADLLARIDPAFDLSRSLEFLEGQQRADGTWRALGPEAPWLTGEVVRLAQSLEKPFSQRFAWPYVHPIFRDQKTGLPGFAAYRDLAELFAAVVGLRDAPITVAFIDLAGFRAFNTRYGQDRGDQVLAVFARALSDLPRSWAVRDGGDEFLVVSAPTDVSLADSLERLRQDWPRRFAAHFGAGIDVVAPRILLTASRAGSLLETRRELGLAIGDLKRHPAGPGGILSTI